MRLKSKDSNGAIGSPANADPEQLHMSNAAHYMREVELTGCPFQR
jgi:hypothetical protein